MVECTKKILSFLPWPIWLLAMTCGLLMIGCSDQGDDLQQYIASVKARKAGFVEPVPQIKPYQSFAYSAANLRDPFQPFSAYANNKKHPDINRVKEVLEAYPLDSLHVVGLLDINNKTWAIIATPTGAVYRVGAGNYIGQNYGQIMQITNTGINITESVPSDKGWIKRNVTLTLNQASSENAKTDLKKK